MPPTATEEPVTKPAKSAPHTPRATAESMAGKQRDISVSEFFAKNRHLLGFDNPRKALLTTVKEAVDNSLDASEEAGILPDITVVIEDLQPDRPATAKSSRYRVTVIDNGPGIVRKQVEHIFGRLLYGSKFHRLKMSRGQQGIGISAAGMYGLLTTGKPMVIHTKPKSDAKAHHIELAMNTKTNRAEVTTDEETRDFPPERLRELTPGTREATFLAPGDYPTGTSVSIELEGKYQRGRGSVDEFLELTAIANPHAKITFVRPSKFASDDGEDGALDFKKKAPATAVPALDAAAAPAAPLAPESGVVSEASIVTTQEADGVVIFPRNVTELPPETKEIQPHPKGIELGILLQMLKEAEGDKNPSLYHFLQEKFSRVSAATASTLCEKIGATSRTKVGDIDHAAAEKLFKELQDAKLPPPPTDCLAPIGVRQLLAGMLKGVRAEFYAASSREAEVYRGRPFQIEAAIAFGGELPADEPARVIRFANRVPLLYQQSACSSFKSVTETNWRNYDLQQPRGSVPVGAMCIMIHMASVWVPFTSESKEAIADYDEIRKEMKLALMECGRKLGTYLRKRQKMRREAERRDVFERYIGEIAKAVAAVNGQDARKLFEVLQAQAKKRTAIADLQLDEEGKAVKDENPEDQDGVIIVEPVGGPQGPGGPASGGKSAPTPAASNAASQAPPSARSESRGSSKRGESAKSGSSSRRSGGKSGKSAEDEQPSLIDVRSSPASKSEKSGASNKKDPNPSPRGPATPAEAGKPAKPAKPTVRLDLKNNRTVPVSNGLFNKD